MDASEIINKILKIKELKLIDENDLAMKCQIIPNTLKVAIGRNKLSPEIVKKLHDNLGIHQEFLKTGEGPVMDENWTGQIDDGLNPDKMYRDLVESNTDYRLVPKTILDEEYRIVLKTESDRSHYYIEELLKSKSDEIKSKSDEIRKTNELLDAQRRLIVQLEDEINKLRGGGTVHTQNAN